MFSQKSMHVFFDEFDDLIINKEDEEEISQKEVNDNQDSSQIPPKSRKTISDHPPEKIIGDTSDGIRTRQSFINRDDNMKMISHIKPKNIQEAICEESWAIAMKEELSQFEKSEIWNLVPKPQNQSIIKTKRISKNKLDEEDKLIKNKTRLLAQGYNQQENIDYNETFNLVAN